MRAAVRFSAEASDELEAAASWYEDQLAGLGSELMDAVDDVVKTLAEWPRIGAPIDEMPPGIDVRRAPVGRFPFHLAYVVLDDHVQVIAVAHDRRQPLYWAPRASQ